MFAAALIFTRIPQYVLSPAIGALLPRASRVLSTEGQAAFDRFLLRALGVVGLVGVLMVGGTWLFGGLGAQALRRRRFSVAGPCSSRWRRWPPSTCSPRPLSQGLFALGPRSLAALGWFVGLLAVRRLPCRARVGVVERVSYSLAVGTFAAAAAQAVFYLALRRRAGA